MEKKTVFEVTAWAREIAKGCDSVAMDPHGFNSGGHMQQRAEKILKAAETLEDLAVLLEKP